MEDLIVKLFMIIVSGVVGFFGWVFKGTAVKADKAVSLSKELKGRVEKLETTQDEVHALAVSFGKVETKVENIEGTLRRIETYMLEERKR